MQRSCKQPKDATELQTAGQSGQSTLWHTYSKSCSRVSTLEKF
jgi:hypothetical protein